METHFQYKANRRRSYCGVLLADRYSIPKSNLSNPILVIQISFTFLLISFRFSFFFSFQNYVPEKEHFANQ